VQVFPRHQPRLPLGPCCQLRHQCVERQLFLLLRGHRRGRVALCWERHRPPRHGRGAPAGPAPGAPLWPRQSRGARASPGPPGQRHLALTGQSPG
jgi:hypothetical protein